MSGATLVFLGAAIWVVVALLGVDCAFEIGAAAFAGFLLGVFGMALAQAAKHN